MDNKYYTPTIEEFHPGFELEEKLKHEKDWSKRVVGLENNLDWLNREVNAGFIRAKHLDREDIESLGFMLFTTVNFMTYTFPNRDVKKDRVGYNMHVYKDIMSITIQRSTHENTLFRGVIKNKSELKRVLTQIGVL